MNVSYLDVTQQPYVLLKVDYEDFNQIFSGRQWSQGVKVL
jgi:hypothetical protein